MVIYCFIFIVYRFTVAGLLASRPKSMDGHLLSQASGDSFEIGDGRILIYSSFGVQNSIF